MGILKPQTASWPTGLTSNTLLIEKAASAMATAKWFTVPAGPRAKGYRVVLPPWYMLFDLVF